jgi:hypothetical protein
MKPERINRVAMWGSILIVIAVTVVLGSRWASGSNDDTGTPPGIALLGVADPSSSDETTSTASPQPLERSQETTTTTQLESVVLDATLETVAPAAPNTTDPPASSTTEPLVSTSLPEIATTTTEPPLEPPTTIPITTTTTTLPPATTTSTTLPAPSTTTTAPTTTTTTTTLPVSTTTTTEAPAVPGLFLTRFDGRAEGDTDAWSVRIDVTLKGTIDGSYRSQVFVSWGGGSGSAVLSTGSNGRGRATVGPFSGTSVTLSITEVQATGWDYMPSLNQASSSLSVAAPGS